jgi:hypothetical protein
MQESSHVHRNSYTLDGQFHALESRHRQQTTMAATAASIPPRKSVVVNPVPVLCHSAVKLIKGILKKIKNDQKWRHQIGTISLKVAKKLSIFIPF